MICPKCNGERHGGLTPECPNCKSDEALSPVPCSPSSKTPKDFVDTGSPITAWAFYEVFERKHCGKGWLRAQMGKMEHDLAAAHASLREMIDLNETTGDPDPEITDRARALLPENSELSQPTSANK